MADHPWLQAAAIEYWRLLMEVVGACQPSGLSRGDLLDRCASTWGLVYGIARLDIHGKIPQTVPADPVALVHSGIDAIYRGWQE